MKGGMYMNLTYLSTTNYKMRTIILRRLKNKLFNLAHCVIQYSNVFWYTHE